MKRGSLSKLRVKINFSIKLLNDELADHETKSDAVGVYFFLLVLDHPKKLKKFWLILIFDSNSGVVDSNLDMCKPIIQIENSLDYDVNLTIPWSEFNGIIN